MHAQRDRGMFVHVKMTRLYTTHCTCTVFKKHLCLSHGADAFVVLRQEEADGHEELVDADPELLLVLASRGQWEEPTRLDDVLEDVLAGLGVRGVRGERGGERTTVYHMMGNEKANQTSPQVSVFLKNIVVLIFDLMIELYDKK